MGTLANLDVQSVIDRIAAGEFQSHIAKYLGVSKQALHQAVKNHPDYQTAILTRNIASLDLAQAAIFEGEHAKDEEVRRLGVDLPRAREAFNSAMKRAERECRAEYGVGPQVAIQINELASRPTDELLAELQSLIERNAVLSDK